MSKHGISVEDIMAAIASGALDKSALDSTASAINAAMETAKNAALAEAAALREQAMKLLANAEALAPSPIVPRRGRRSSSSSGFGGKSNLGGFGFSGMERSAGNLTIRRSVRSYARNNGLLYDVVAVDSAIMAGQTYAQIIGALMPISTQLPADASENV